ncbi:MAG: hypothetical protein WB421_20705 [Terriglobales bacterium]
MRQRRGMQESQRAARSSRFPPVILVQVVLPACIGFQVCLLYISSISLIPNRSPTTSNSPQAINSPFTRSGTSADICQCESITEFGPICNKVPSRKPRNGRSTVNSQGNVSTQAHAAVASGEIVSGCAGIACSTMFSAAGAIEKDRANGLPRIKPAS